mmetsp:Transcript_8112/g.15709  ORF Transcript_8112/g.15709 Transcript_8112/m.15709 type:complete len:87 (-) Transcript_8112:367-627(-)
MENKKSMSSKELHDIIHVAWEEMKSSGKASVSNQKWSRLQGTQKQALYHKQRLESTSKVIAIQNEISTHKATSYDSMIKHLQYATK